MSIAKKYRFYFYDPDDNTVQVFPSNDDLLFSVKREQGQIYYRRALDTSLVVKKGNGYQDLLTIEDGPDRATRMRFEVKRVKNGIEEDFHDGYLCLDAARFNKSRCFVEFPIINSDAYTCIEDEWEDEVNIIHAAIPRVTVTTVYGTDEEDTCTVDDDPSSSQYPLGFFEAECFGFGGEWSFKEYVIQNQGGGLYRHIVTVVRRRAEVPCSGGSPVEPPGGPWTLLENNCPTNAVYVRKLNMLPDTENSSDAEFPKTYRFKYPGEDLPATIDNGVRLSSVLNRYVPCDLTIVSNFFGINPDYEYPINIAYESALAKLQNLLIFQKADIKRASAADNSTLGLWTFKDLLDSLKYHFQVYHKIEGNILRLEHISYYKNNATSTFNLNTFNSTKGLNEYEYDTGQQYRYEVLEYAEATSLAFKGSPIKYPNSCNLTETSKTTITISDVNNDIQFMFDNPDLVSDQGFTFVPAIEISGTLYIGTEANEQYQLNDLNGHMAVPNLLANYYQHDRPFITGVMNNQITTFQSAKKLRVQVPLSAELTSDEWLVFDGDDHMKTEVSDEGELLEAVWSAKTEKVELNTVH